MVKKTVNYKNSIINIIKEKYIYFFTGLTVIIIILIIPAILMTKNIKTLTSIKKTVTKITSIIKKPVIQLTPTPTDQSVYLVKKGDNLWTIAEGAYGSGYNAYDIAQTNHLIDPNVIETNQKLIIPNVRPKTPTRGEIAPLMTQKAANCPQKYTVKSGDYLWKIALNCYGDGYAWVRIANANKLVNPDLIHKDNVLIIP